MIAIMAYKTVLDGSSCVIASPDQIGVLVLVEGENLRTLGERQEPTPNSIHELESKRIKQGPKVGRQMLIHCTTHAPLCSMFTCPAGWMSFKKHIKLS